MGLILNAMMVFSQSQASVFVGDTLMLSVTGAGGVVQWQQSEDSILWNNIVEGDSTILQFIVSSSNSEKRFFRAVTIDTSMCNEQMIISEVISTKIVSDTTELQIGDYALGGIIFYTDGAGHGLIATSSYQDGAQWGCYSISIPEATSMTNGEGNTDAIVASCNYPYTAARICDTVIVANYSDWFLPAIDQLNILYQQKDVVGGFAQQCYWSSTESNSYNAYQLFFPNGNVLQEHKGLGAYFRCVRAF